MKATRRIGRHSKPCRFNHIGIATPTSSSAVFRARRVEAFGSGIPRSMLLRPVVDIPASFARSVWVMPNIARTTGAGRVKNNYIAEILAEEVGFEPTVRFPARRFSRPVP